MSEADGTIPTTVMRKRKRKRGSGFRYSTKKALECSKLSKDATKGRVLELGSVKKALTYPIELLVWWTSETAQLDLHLFTQLTKMKRRGLM
jgi:hypothetical protein